MGRQILRRRSDWCISPVNQETEDGESKEKSQHCFYRDAANQDDRGTVTCLLKQRLADVRRGEGNALFGEDGTEDKTGK